LSSLAKRLALCWLDAATLMGRTRGHLAHLLCAAAVHVLGNRGRACRMHAAAAVHVMGKGTRVMIFVT